MRDRVGRTMNKVERDVQQVTVQLQKWRGGRMFRVAKLFHHSRLMLTMSSYMVAQSQCLNLIHWNRYW